MLARRRAHFLNDSPARATNVVKLKMAKALGIDVPPSRARLTTACKIRDCHE